MSVSKHKKVQTLVICIGNIGRGDDALGWKIADWLCKLNHENITVEYRYQLQVEDAHLVSEFPLVVFVDATKEVLQEGFSLQPCHAADHYFYSSHLQSPQTVLYLAEKLYGKFPEAFLLQMSGYQWELGEVLSHSASLNLHKAGIHIESWLNTYVITNNSLKMKQL